MASPAHETWEKIAAFADGELDGQQCCELLREAMADPDHAKCVEYQRQLRELLAGCMDCEKTMRCPDELKRCIEGLSEQPDAESDAGHSDPKPAAQRSGTPGAAAVAAAPSVLARLGNWVPLAAAAALFLASLGVFFAASNPGDPGSDGYTADSPFTPRLVRSLEARHVRCSSGVSTPVLTDQFPDEVEALDDAVVERLGVAADGLPLDLSSIGYDYRVAGLCTAPGRGAVHVIYAGPADAATGQRPMLSLWIKAYDPDADPDLESGRTYAAADTNAPHPTLVWRDADLIFYLVGDAPRQVEQAQQVLALRS